jgi:phosphoglucomutase
MNYDKVDATADEIKNAGEPLLAANIVEVIVKQGNEYTPTLIVSHAFLTYKRRHKTGFVDG